MKCLVTGATGFIGNELCRLLLERGHDLVPYSRSGRPLDDGTATASVDLHADNLTVEQLASADVVFHLAGVAHQQAEAQDYDLINHRAAVELALRAQEAGVNCFLFLSSVKAMGAAAGEGARDELECVLPTDPYGLSKAMAEADLRQELSGAEMRVRIVRPALVYGHGVKGNLDLLSRAVDRGLPRPPEGGGRSMIAVSDLCELLLLLSDGGEPGVSTFIATDGERYSLRRVYDALRRSRGREPGLAWCPRWVWWLGCRLLDLLRPAGESTWQKLFASELYSNARVLQATDWRPRLRLEESLQRRRSET